MPVIIQLRRGTAAEWTAADPTLAEGEIGLETDTPAFKIGDGTTAWTSLAYAVGGTTISVKDEGSTLSGTVTTLDFVGDGVTATEAGGIVTVTVPGAGGVADIVDLPTAETTTTKVLAPDGAGGVEFRAETGGGSGNMSNDGKPTIWTPAASPATEDDEFGDAASQSGPVNGLDAKWSKHNLGTAGWSVLNSAIAPGCFLFDIPTGQSADQSIYQAAPAGDFTLAVRFTVGYVTDRQMWAVFVVDSSGNGISVNADIGPGSAAPWFTLRQVTSWAQASTTTAIMALANDEARYLAIAVSLGLPLTMTIRKASGVYYGAITASDRIISGQNGALEASQTPSAFTPAYIAFGRIFGTGSSRVALDTFRKL